jgi:glycosyltransferase involved in cell wall biosynthesis
MDVFVLPSLAVETFSNAALEAMAMERPVVLSDIGGATEMVTHGQNGYVFHKGDDSTLERILTALNNSPDLRRDVGRAGRATVEARFSFQRMADAYERLMLSK